MAANREKQVVELDNRFKYESWDCHHDISTHIHNKSKSLRSRDDKLSFFNSVSEALHVHNPLADPDVVHFICDLYNSVKPQLHHLLEENKSVSTNVFDDDDADVPYRFFIEHLRFEGKSLVLDVPEDGIFVKYETEELEDSSLPTAARCESNFESEQLRKPRGRKRKKHLQTNVDPKVTSTRSFGKPKQPLPLSTIVRPNADFKVKEEDDDGHCPPDLKGPLIEQPKPLNVEQWWRKQKARARKHSAFRDKLMDDLKRPYSEEEYRMLLKKLSEKKPTEKQRVLRSCTKRYNDVTRPPKSFLDDHDDLAKRIDSVRDDHPRVLNLLRGYFYWLTNVAQEGSFHPWEDASCLKVLPQ